MLFLQAITTKYIGPTNTRGARIVAKAQAGRLVVPYDHSLEVSANHAAAARAFAQKWDWDGTWVGGGTDEGACFVRLNGASIDASCNVFFVEPK